MGAIRPQREARGLVLPKLNDGVRMFLFTVGARVCALPVSVVSEIMREPPVKKMVGAPSFVRGLAVIRGEATPIVDAGKLLAGESSATPRLVVVRIRNRAVALAVSSVLGIRKVEFANLHEPAPLLGGASADLIEALGTVDHDLLMVIRAGQLVPEELWNAIRTGVPRE